MTKKMVFCHNLHFLIIRLNIFSCYWSLIFHLVCIHEVFNFFLLISSTYSYIPDKLLYSCKYFLPVSHCFSNLFSNIIYCFFCHKGKSLKFCLSIYFFLYRFRAWGLTLKGLSYSRGPWVAQSVHPLPLV